MRHVAFFQMALKSVASVKPSVAPLAFELVSVNNAVPRKILLRTQSCATLVALEVVNFSQMDSVDVFRESSLPRERTRTLVTFELLVGLSCSNVIGLRSRKGSGRGRSDTLCLLEISGPPQSHHPLFTSPLTLPSSSSSFLFSGPSE